MTCQPQAKLAVGRRPACDGDSACAIAKCDWLNGPSVPSVSGHVRGRQVSCESMYSVFSILAGVTHTEPVQPLCRTGGGRLPPATLREAKNAAVAGLLLAGTAASS